MLQKDHGFSHVFLFFHLSCDLPGLLLTNAFDFRKPLRFFFHDPEGIFMEFPDDPGRQGNTDPLYRSGSQIAFNREFIFRSLDLQSLDMKLVSISGVLFVMTADLHQFSVPDIMKHSHTGDLFSVCHYIHDGISIVLIPVNDMIHISFNVLHQTSSFLPPDTSST